MNDLNSSAPAAAAGSALRKRVISAAVMLPMAIAAAWFGDWAFGALVALAAGLMLWEWQRLPVLSATAPTWTRNRPVWWLLGLIYLVLPCVALVWLRQQPEHGRHIVFWLFCVVWATDTGAYFAGRSIGGPKLIPSISPNKTWAGLLGGMVAAAVVGGLVGAINPVLPAFALAGLAGTVAVVSQAGDFTESAIKRAFGVKDASQIIPGHGGVLDRLDGLLFAAPFVAVCDLIAGRTLWG